MNKHGQTQILAASAMAIVMLTGGLLALEYANLASRNQVKASHRSEMRAALETAVKRASDIYHDQAGCDPVILNEKLSLVNQSGQMQGDPAAGSFPTQARRMNIVVNRRTYTVYFGSVNRLAWDSGADPSWPDNPGTSQDAVIEVWTTGPSRVYLQQRAVLVNNCTYPCATAYCNNTVSTVGVNCDSSDDLVSLGLTAGPCTNATDSTVFPCSVAHDPVIAYHSILPTTGNWAGSGCYTARAYGDLNGKTCEYNGGLSVASTDNYINVSDLVILRNYLRSGETAASHADILAGTAGMNSCADVNRDRFIDESDLNILEKFLRGYVTRLPGMPANFSNPDLG